MRAGMQVGRKEGFAEPAATMSIASVAAPHVRSVTCQAGKRPKKHPHRAGEAKGTARMCTYGMMPGGYSYPSRNYTGTSLRAGGGLNQLLADTYASRSSPEAVKELKALDMLATLGGVPAHEVGASIVH